MKLAKKCTALFIYILSMLNIVEQSRARPHESQTRLADLIEADCLQLPTQINAMRTDAENSHFLQTMLSINGANCHSRRECWRNGNSDDVENALYDGPCTVLQK